jgi:4-hydroxy-tetrahydrodipicolinate reductase
MHKVFVNGSSGKMGTSLSNIINKKNDLYINNKDISSADVIIDFSHPDSTSRILQQCSINKIPLIIGTTGLKENLLNEIKKASEFIPIVLASNMSIGINQLKINLGKYLQNIKNETTCVIEETHHTKKIDKPSGTAIEINNVIKELDRKKNISSIETVSIRKGDIFGIHKITFQNTENSCVFKHQTLSRDVYANGALHCAERILNKSPGLYNFEDVIN